MGNEKMNAKTEGAVTAAELEQELRKAQPAPESTQKAEADEAQELNIGDGVKLELRQEPYKIGSKTYYSYYVPMKVFGKQMKLEVRPEDGDVNGFMYLQGMFEQAEAETGERKHWLTVQKKSMKGNDGKRTSYLTYAVIGNDDGNIISVPVRPYGKTTKYTLEELYRQKTEAQL